jgi:hypothetical protein
VDPDPEGGKSAPKKKKKLSLKTRKKLYALLMKIICIETCS